MLAHSYGSPVIMSSYNFEEPGEGPPVRVGSTDICSPFDEECYGWMFEHRLRSIMEMVKFRNAVTKSPVRYWKNFGVDQVGFCRGDKGFFAVNNNALLDLDQEVYVCVSEGKYCDVLSIDENGICWNNITVNEKRVARIHISKTKEIPVVAFYALTKII